MILPDANLLLYAVNTDSIDHSKSLKWWQDLIESDAAIGLYTGVVLCFCEAIHQSSRLRTTTHHARSISLSTQLAGLPRRQFD